jgi:ABC-type dipeptide/oligopeptide/nickel transport system permease subunit
MMVVEPEMPATPRATRPRDLWQRFRRNRPAVAGVALVALVALAAILADVITAHPPVGFFPDESRLGPSGRHWFGTDVLGRDIFSRVVYGARSALVVGVVVVSMILVVGIVVGGIAGYVGGIVDTVLSRIIDVFLAFTFLVGALILATALGRGRVSVIVAIAAFSWVSVARIFRASVLAVREEPYVEAARALGAGHVRIFLRHVLPNALPPTLVYAFALIGIAIVAEAALSFLGLGVTEPEPSWGLMIADGRRFLRTLPHVVIFPGVALTVTAMGFILVGDGLRDALDPRLS